MEIFYLCKIGSQPIEGNLRVLNLTWTKLFIFLFNHFTFAIQCLLVFSTPPPLIRSVSTFSFPCKSLIIIIPQFYHLISWGIPHYQGERERIRWGGDKGKWFVEKGGRSKGERGEYSRCISDWLLIQCRYT